MVISVASKTSFTQFSRMMQPDLPEGVLGEMTQRMRAPLTAGRFTEAVDSSVQLFVGSVAQKMGFSVQDLEKPKLQLLLQIHRRRPCQSRFRFLQTSPHKVDHVSLVSPRSPKQKIQWRATQPPTTQTEEKPAEKETTCPTASHRCKEN